jgi:lactate racemase
MKDIPQDQDGRLTQAMPIRTVLRYGSDGLPFKFQKTAGFLGVLAGTELLGLRDPQSFVADSLRNPIASRSLSEIAQGRKNACVVISDSTRPTPNRLILPTILDILETAGIPPRSVTILVATGMHRSSTEEELSNLVGSRISNTCVVVDHFARRTEETLEVGLISGKVPALVNKRYVEADLKILTGFIEPHMWAGFSGGRKSILPGISALETLKHMHGPEMIAHPGCEYGVLDGNPFHEAGLEIMKKAGADFIVNVTLNARREITGVFSGHPVNAHLTGCDLVSRNCARELKEPLDFIITTNSGAPLDCNLYQTVKGITGAATVVKEGGDIVIASRCNEGVGSPEYRQILEMVDSPESFVCRVLAGEFFIPDQWCAQEMYQVIAGKTVWIYTDGLLPDELRAYYLQPVASLENCVEALLAKHGQDARWAVVPDGPMVILKLVKGHPND